MGVKDEGATDKAEPAGQPSLSRGIIGALRFTSVASILTIAFGVGTNKVIAVVAGTEGVALIGLFRTLSSIVTAILSLGVSELVMQRISTTQDRRLVHRILGATFIFFVFQSTTVLLVATFFSGAISNLLFGRQLGPEHTLEIRLVLGLTIGVLALQAATASLNGLVRVREASRVSIMTSLLTVLTVYPFLRLGRVGLTLVIGVTCFIGAAIGARYAWRASGLTMREFRAPRSWKEFIAALPISQWLILGPILLTGGSLAVQALVTRHYGLVELGYYNAASLLETTSIMVLMSAMRSYYVPMLGKLATQAEKRDFINKTLTILLVLLLLGVSVLLLGAPYLIRILFSPQFAPARDILLVLAISMLGQVFIWCGAMFILHKADYGTFLWVESIWVAIRVTGTASCVLLRYPLIAVAWVHVVGCTLSAIIYGLVIRRRYGGAIVNAYNAGIGIIVLGLFLLGKVIVDQGKVLPQAAFAATVVAVCTAVGRRSLKSLT